MMHGLPPFMDILISVGYGLIAWNFRGMLTQSGNPKARRALVYLIAIFLLCMSVGYLGHLFNINDTVLSVLGTGLILATYGFVLTGQAKYVEIALEQTEQEIDNV